MPRNGSGVFSLVAGNPVVTGTTISSTVQNATTADIATALTQSFSVDGQAPATANWNMAGFKLTMLGVGSVTGDSAEWNQVFNNPTFTVPSATASPAIGDSSTKLATTAFVASTAFSSALPGVSAATKAFFLTNNGAISFWQANPANLYLQANYGGL